MNAISAWHTALFWTRVDRGGLNDCWPWTGHITDKGYGQAPTGTDRTAQTHVVAYTLIRGPVPEGLTLDHLCHTEDPTCPQGAACQHRRCCNPLPPRAGHPGREHPSWAGT